MALPGSKSSTSSRSESRSPSPKKTSSSDPYAKSVTADSDSKKRKEPLAEEKDPEPPQPVSSDDEGIWVTGTPQTTKTKTDVTAAQGEMSRLFAPYRTVGVVTSGRPFYMTPNQNSTSAMLCMPIGDRFQILSCDRIQPVLVSQKVPAGKKTPKGPQSISHLVSDTSLSISVVVHGQKSTRQHVTLYRRTQPLKTIHVAKQKHWNIVDFLHLGRMKLEMKGEKEGKLENAAIAAAILSYDTSFDRGQEEEDSVEVVGDSDSDDSGDDGVSSSSSSSGEEETIDCQCQIVILLATRDSIRVHKRIRLTQQPTFTPRVALHPSTYVNKIVLGGFHTSQGNGSTTPALILLNIRSGKVIHEFSCIHKKKVPSKCIVSALEQSPAVDTVAVGTSHGKVYLINLRQDKTLFSLNHKPRDGSTKPIRISSLSFRTDGSAMNYGIAPMAVGRSDGTITVWDLNPPEATDDDDNTTPSKKTRTILTEIFQVHAGGVSKLMYLPQEPLLVSIGRSSNSVLMHIFDNPDHSGRILRQREGHTAPPSRIQYLHPGASAGGGIMVNMADGTDASACQILSAGSLDRTLRVFSTARSVLDKEYSQGKGLEKKAKKLGMDSTKELLLPPVTAMASCEARSRDWGDLVTIHKGHAMAYVWSNKRGAQWGPVLRQPTWNVSAMKAPPPPTTHATSVAMSACGNFALVGTKGGVIYKYNVQSGNTRGSYPADAGTDEEEGYQRKIMQAGDVKRTMKALERKMKISNRASDLDRRDHDAVQEAIVTKRRREKLKQASHSGHSVTGIAVDSTNKTMISVGADSKLILWHFATHAPHKKSPYKLPSPATLLCHVRDSDLAAIALEDFTTLLFDCTTLSIVRRFGVSSASHTGPICDVAFSPDGRTLYSASLDGTVRIWDVPTNTCVDWLGFETSPTALAVSPTGEFLATSHIGKLGLSLWSDRSFYQTVSVNGTKELAEPFRMDEPRPLAEGWERSNENMPGHLLKAISEKKKSEMEDGDAAEDSKLPAVAKEAGLITLSNLPPAHWKNLFHLELIKERNKPKEAPKKPPSAPFFLQWRAGDTSGDQPSQETSNQLATPAKGDEDEWKAAWSDDENGEGATLDQTMADESSENGMEDANSKIATTKSAGAKRGLDSPSCSRIIKSGERKRKKISHHRSRLATLLSQRSDTLSDGKSGQFQEVTDHLATLGPSSIDVSLSSLCNGMHDLDEGLPLLRMACAWLVEACESRERYEAVNAYLHRFLHLHATVIAGIEDPSWNKDEKDQPLTPEEQEERARDEEERKELIDLLSQLRKAQQSALNCLNEQLQSSLCLLRHFSRIV